MYLQSLLQCLLDDPHRQVATDGPDVDVAGEGGAAAEVALRDELDQRLGRTVDHRVRDNALKMNSPFEFWT